MNIQFNTQIALKLSMHEAIFLGWLQQHYDQRPIQTEELENIFAFWKDETLHKVLLKLEERGILQTRRDKQHFCIFSINPTAYQTHTGQTSAEMVSHQAVTDANLKKHLQRFQSSESLLNNKLSELVQQSSQEMLEYAISEGLSAEQASISLDKFLHYVAANPDRFWNTDLESYWRFWVSNSKDRIKQTQKSGKQSAIEASNQYAASNWLKKKSQQSEPFESVKLTRK